MKIGTDLRPEDGCEGLHMDIPSQLILSGVGYEGLF